jgi:hypothetical protein
MATWLIRNPLACLPSSSQTSLEQELHRKLDSCWSDAVYELLDNIIFYSYDAYKVWDVGMLICLRFSSYPLIIINRMGIRVEPRNGKSTLLKSVHGSSRISGRSLKYLAMWLKLKLRMVLWVKLSLVWRLSLPICKIHGYIL